ncbi:MAG: adenine deaminase [Phycisphaerae bacterium]
MAENQLQNLIDVAAGRKPADLVIKNGRIVNVFSHEIHRGDVAVQHGRIAGIGAYRSSNVIDLNGRYLCPGFIDAHVHIESSMLAVPEFARVVVPHGTTTVVADPHEFANVMGTEGISYVLRAAKSGPLSVYVMLSSCVPASPLESAGAVLSAEDLQPFLANPWVLGLAEMMNYPGVVAAQPDVLGKIRLTRDRIIDGHAPGLAGTDLTAYAAAGVMSDHECITAEEAAEKLRRGLHIMIREGSQTRNLDALVPLVTPANASRFLFCTDDKDVRDLIEEGQIDYMVRKAVARGLDPILAVRLGSHNAARYFGLRQTGAILPGYRADMTVLDNLSDCRVTHVFRWGRLVAQDGRFLESAEPAGTLAPMRGTINIRPIEPADLAIPAPRGSNSDHPPAIQVIQVLDNRIDTDRSVLPASVRNGELVADPSRDLAKMVVVERHRASGEIGRCFAHGFGLKGGAMASSVAHDAHNLIAVGTNDSDMHLALMHLVKLQGGLVVVREGRVLADVPLPIAGLVTDQPAAVTAQKLRDLTRAAHDLGCRFDQPLMALAFLSLSVIGKLKLTNQGLIDVERFEPIPLIAG